MNLPDPWHFARPDVAQHYLHLLADAPRRPLAVFGPRQIGKTHFVTHDLADAAGALGWRPVYVDLWAQPDPLAAVNTALASVLRELSTRTGRTAVTSIGAVGLSLGLAPDAGLDVPAEPAAELAVRFAELVRLQPGKPVLLLLDEAQTLVRPGAGDAAMRAIRALFNANPGKLVLMFTGSSKAQLMSLVGDHSKTAFKLAAHMDFPLLGVGFLSFVAARFKQITQRELALPDLDWAFSQLLHRPGELIDFVRILITDSPVPGQALREAMQAFKLKSRPDVGFETQFSACTPVQQAVLIEVATNQKLFSRETRERVARYAGGPLSAVAPVTVNNALAQLEARGVIAKSEGRGRYAFEDEHLRTWIEHVAQRPR